MVNVELKELSRRSTEIQACIEQWIQDNDKKHVPLRFNQQDQVKLLKLRTWQLRYLLTPSEILNLIVPVLRGQMRGRGTNYGLGISVRTLVGQGAERILQEEITKYYPGKEHIHIWRDRERSRQLEAELKDVDELRTSRVPTLMRCETVEQYLSKYRKRVLSARDERETEVTKGTRRRKAYRWSPWR